MSEEWLTVYISYLVGHIFAGELAMSSGELNLIEGFINDIYNHGFRDGYQTGWVGSTLVNSPAK